MGGRGGSLGGSQGTARVARTRTAAPAAAAPAAPRYDVTTMASMSDAQLTSTLDSIFTSTRVDNNQQNTDTQRFFNAIGWSDRKPQVVDETTYENAKRAAGASSWYHTDDTVYGVPDASKFSKQYMGAGRQFLSGGIHGDGTYWADNARGSWAYGSGNKAAQFKGFFNTKTRSISESALDQQIAQWGRSHPSAYRKITNSRAGYGSGIDGTRSIFAAMFGYNVIEYSPSGYRTVLDRSVTTVSRTIKHRDTTPNLRQDW